jgi:hypothetical protein
VIADAADISVAVAVVDVVVDDAVRTSGGSGDCNAGVVLLEGRRTAAAHYAADAFAGSVEASASAASSAAPVEPRLLLLHSHCSWYNVGIPQSFDLPIPGVQSARDHLQTLHRLSARDHLERPRMHRCRSSCSSGWVGS